MDLNDQTFGILALERYIRPDTVISEFDTDLKRLKYIKRLIRKYKITGDLKERLILNHIIILANVFGIEFTVKMLFYKLDITCYGILKTFLVYLNYMPDKISSVNGHIIYSSDIHLDQNVVDVLRKI